MLLRSKWARILFLIAVMSPKQSADELKVISILPIKEVTSSVFHSRTVVRHQHAGRP
jgi:hypothetical protein